MAFKLRRSKKRDDVIVDSVTGAFNRRQLDTDIAAGIDTSDQPTATLLIDVDDFSAYNGKKGSATGNQVLERVSWVIMATVRTTDVVYRHGPSSFCVLLPATSDEDALSAADRIRENVLKMPLLAESRVTISVGFATGAGNDLATTIERADAVLSAGARSGSNQVFSGRSNVAGVAPGTVPDAAQTAVSALAPPMAAPEVTAPPASNPLAPPSL